MIDNSSKTTRTAEEGQRIQAEVDERDRQNGPEKKSPNPMQAGQREYPTRFPAQHLAKPGSEKDLDQAPMFEAPAYQGSDKLKDRSPSSVPRRQ